MFVMSVVLHVCNAYSMFPVSDALSEHPGMAVPGMRQHRHSAPFRPEAGIPENKKDNTLNDDPF